jgi:hypothetical protein
VWAAAFESDGIPLGSLHNPGNCLSHVVHMGRLQFCRPTAEDWISGKPLEELEDDGEKCVIRPKHDCRADQDGTRICRADRQFTLATAANIRRSRLSIGTDARDVHELLNPEPARFHSDALSTLDMHCMERLLAVFDIETDRVYHTARASDRISHRLPGSNIAIDRPKSRIVGPEQRSGLTWVSRRDPHGTPVFVQATNNASAEETGCAKDGDYRWDHSGISSPFRPLARLMPWPDLLLTRRNSGSI